MKEYYPFFISLKGKKILVVGGGKVAERKIKSLIKYPVEIKVISDKITKGLEKLVLEGLINWEKKLFDEKDISKEFFLVISATDNEELNDFINKLCDKKGILVNNVSGRGRVIFPAMVNEGDISIAISSSGFFPYLTKFLKTEIRKFIKPYSNLLKITKPLRSTLLTGSKKSSYNSKIFKEILSLSHQIINNSEEQSQLEKKIREILEKKNGN